MLRGNLRGIKLHKHGETVKRINFDIFCAFFRSAYFSKSPPSATKSCRFGVWILMTRCYWCDCHWCQKCRIQISRKRFGKGRASNGYFGLNGGIDFIACFFSVFPLNEGDVEVLHSWSIFANVCIFSFIVCFSLFVLPKNSMLIFKWLDETANL